MTEQQKCRFCGSVATVHIALASGCACYPNDREQWLCEQHYYKSEPIGACIVTVDLLA